MAGTTAKAGAGAGAAAAAGWNFDNTYVRLPKRFYSRRQPVPCGSRAWCS